MRRIQFHKIWVQQCRATGRIKRRFGVNSALDYLLGEKLMDFADAAERYPEFAAELPRFQAAVWNLFNPYELAGYLSSLKPARRKKLQELLYVGSFSKLPSRRISRRIDRAWPGVRSMRPWASRVKIIWCTEGGETRKYASEGGHPWILP